MNVSGNILIVDDEPAIRGTLSRILQSSGYTVTCGTNGVETLKLLKDNVFDLVILDLQLPDVNGIQVLHNIRRIYPDLPVILLTAHGSMDSVLQAMHLGAMDYLLKPIKPEEFLNRVRSTLQNQLIERRRKELRAQISALQRELYLLEQTDLPITEEDEFIPDTRFLYRGKLTLDLQTQRASLGDTILSIPPSSFEYLVVLARHSPEIVSYQSLVSEAQGYQTTSLEARELAKWHIHILRQALEVDPSKPQHIINLRGKGYRIVFDESRSI